MILAFILLAGVIVGFFAGASVYSYKHTEIKTPFIYIKLVICAVVIVGGVIYFFTKDWYQAFCLVLGVAVGMSPYLTIKNKEENTDDKRDE